MFPPKHHSVVLNRAMLNLQNDAPGDAAKGPATVLLIEDETAIRNLVSRFLSLNGFRVLAAENSDQARALWREHRKEISLLLADIIMASGLSGREIAEEFRMEDSNLRILLTSGFNLETTATNSLGAQMNFIPKPYRPEQLLAAVRSALAGMSDCESYGKDSSS
jgi:two-component system, cell cycle sensor histidine kinase and response regulator CckA